MKPKLLEVTGVCSEKRASEFGLQTSRAVIVSCETPTICRHTRAADHVVEISSRDLACLELLDCLPRKPQQVVDVQCRETVVGHSTLDHHDDLHLREWLRLTRTLPISFYDATSFKGVCPASTSATP